MPALWKFETKEAILEELRDFAEEIKEGEAKGQFAVKVVPSKKVDEFRDKNIDQARKLEAATGAVKTLRGVLGLGDDDDIDADKLSTELGELRNTKKLVDDGKLEKKEDIERELEKRTENMRKTLEEAKTAALKALEAEKARADENEGKFKRTFIDKDVYSVCTDSEIGLEPWAMEYILQDAYSLFSVEENNRLVPKKDGSIVYGESGGEPMTVKEWVTSEIRKSKPQFFKKSGGGSAQGADATKKFGGLTEEAFMKLPASERLAMANAADNKAKVRR